MKTVWDDAKSEADKFFNPLRSKTCFRCEKSFKVTYGLWCRYGGCYVTPDNKCANWALDDYLSLEMKVNR